MFPLALVCCWLVGADVARVNLSMDLSGGLVRCRFLVILCRSAFKVRRSVEYESSFDESCKQKINHRKCQVDTKWISHESILAMLYGINRMFACDRLFVCVNINLICCGASEEKFGETRMWSQNFSVKIYHHLFGGARSASTDDWNFDLLHHISHVSLN